LNRDIKLRFVFALYVLLVVFVSLVPGSGFSLGRHSDKIGHFLVYSGMIILAFLTFRSKPAQFLAAVFAIGLGIVLEWGQSFVPGRDTSLIDGIANTLGVFSGMIFFRFQGRTLAEWLGNFL
jgi:VanZ family protein